MTVYPASVNQDVYAYDRYHLLELADRIAVVIAHQAKTHDWRHPNTFEALDEEWDEELKASGSD